MSDFAIGATVAVKTLGNRKGTVVASDGRGRYRVEIGGLTVSCREDDITATDAPKARSRKKPREMPSPPVAGGTSRSRETGPSAQGGGGGIRIDLHGMRVEEALTRVDEALDRALLAGAERLEIVHGRGTGRIRDALHRHLASLPVIAAFKLHPANPGVTLVYL